MKALFLLDFSQIEILKSIIGQKELVSIYLTMNLLSFLLGVFKNSKNE